jgi:hypothetical protein
MQFLLTVAEDVFRQKTGIFQDISLFGLGKINSQLKVFWTNNRTP